MSWWPFSRPRGSDIPLSPHVSMETVPKSLQTGLDCQPVCILGERWVVPKLIEDQPDYGEPRQPVDYERLPV